MVSSAAQPRVCRTMGDELALADAKAVADVVDIGVDDLVHVAEGMREVAQAFLRVGPICRGREDLKGDATRMPADAAVGLAPERIVEAGFCEREREQQGDAVADALCRGFPCTGHREDDQRPEAEHGSQ